MSEKYNFSEDKTGDIFRQLPPEEKEAVIGDAQEEMAEIHKKAHALAGAGEKPTARHYSTAAEAMADKQEASEQIDSEKEEKEIVLTPEQEEAKKAFIEKLSNAVSLDTYIDNALEIKKQNFLPERIVQQTAKKSLIRCLLAGHIKSAIRIKNEFLLSEEIVSSLEVQQAIRYARTVNLSFDYKWDDKNNDLHFKPDISKEYLTVEEVNNKIKGKEKLILELLQDISSLQKNGVLSDDKNFLQYSEIYKHRLSRDEKIVLSPLLEGIRYDDCDGGERYQRVLLSIFNKERRENVVDNYYSSLIIKYQYENSSFIDQVRINKDDIIFLAARSAVPWGIMYKEFIENLKKLLMVISGKCNQNRSQGSV